MLVVACTSPDDGIHLTSPNPTFPTVRTSSQTEPSHDTKAGQITLEAVVAIPEEPTGVAHGIEGIWVLGRASTDGAALYRLKTREFEQVGSVGIAPVGIATGLGSVWVANGSGVAAVYNQNQEGPGFPSENSVMKIDAKTGELLTTIEIGDPVHLAFGFTDVWVVTTDPWTLVRIDAESLTVTASILLDGSAHSIVIGDRFVWVRLDQAALQIDPATSTIVASYPLPPFTLSIDEVDGRLWFLVGGEGGGLFWFDPDTPETSQATGDHLVAMTGESSIIWAVSESTLLAITSYGTTTEALQAHLGGIVAITAFDNSSVIVSVDTLTIASYAP